MVKVLRSVLAIFAGLVVGFLAVAGGETIGHMVFPVPPGLDIHNSESMAEAMKAMPAGAFGFILGSWAVGTFAGAWIASLIAAVGKLWHGLIIGGLFLLASVAIMLHIPHPTWIWVAVIVVLPTLAYLGAWLAMPRTKPENVNSGVS